MSMRGRFFVLTALVFAVLILTPALTFSQESLASAWWTGPLETPNPNDIPKGHSYVESYLIAQQNNGGYTAKGDHFGADSSLGSGYSNQYTEYTFFIYSFSNQLNLQVLEGFYGIQGGTAKYAADGEVLNPSSEGVLASNPEIRLPWQIVHYQPNRWLPSVTLVGGFDAPAGAGSTNVWTPLFDIWGGRPFWLPGGRILRVHASQDFYFPVAGKTVPMTNCAFSAIAHSASTCTMDQGVYGKSMVGLEYSLTKHWVPAWDFYSTYHSDSKFNRIGDPSTSTRLFAVDPAIEYNFTPHLGIIFGAEISVIGKNTSSYIAPQIALQIFK